MSIPNCPELLEAAKHAVMEWRLHGQLTDSCRRLEAAIAAVEGDDISSSYLRLREKLAPFGAMQTGWAGWDRFTKTEAALDAVLTELTTLKEQKR